MPSGSPVDKLRSHVRFGSKAGIRVLAGNVRSTPESGHQRRVPSCLLWAKRRHRRNGRYLRNADMAPQAPVDYGKKCPRSPDPRVPASAASPSPAIPWNAGPIRSFSIAGTPKAYRPTGSDIKLPCQSAFDKSLTVIETGNKLARSLH